MVHSIFKNLSKQIVKDPILVQLFNESPINDTEIMQSILIDIVNNFKNPRLNLPTGYQIELNSPNNNANYVRNFLHRFALEWPKLPKDLEKKEQTLREDKDYVNIAMEIINDKKFWARKGSADLILFTRYFTPKIIDRLRNVIKDGCDFNQPNEITKMANAIHEITEDKVTDLQHESEDSSDNRHPFTTDLIYALADKNIAALEALRAKIHNLHHSKANTRRMG